MMNGYKVSMLVIFMFQLTTDYVYNGGPITSYCLVASAILVCISTLCDVCTTVKSPYEAFLRMSPHH